MKKTLLNIFLNTGLWFRGQRTKGYFQKVIVTTFVLMFASQMAVEAKPLILGHTVPPSHVWHKVAMRFADNLATMSQGRMKIKVIPLQKLGNEPQLFSMAQSGAISFSILPAAFLANREESLLGWFLPYLFEDVQQAGDAAALPAAGQMLKNLEPHGVVGVGYMFAGMRHVLSIKAVNSPGDLINKKIRAFPSPIFNDWWNVNGAAPTALPLAEIAPSLSTNLLDAVDVDLDIIVGLKYHQQAKYLALTNHMSFPSVLFASKKWWNALTPGDRQLVNTAYREAELYGVDTQVKAEAENLTKLKQDGAVVTGIDMAPFMEKGSQISKKYTDKNALIRQFASEVKAASK